jgi:hypothetical protein
MSVFSVFSVDQSAICNLQSKIVAPVGGDDPFREDAGPAAPRCDLFDAAIFARGRSPRKTTPRTPTKNQTTQNNRSVSSWKLID